MFELIVGMYVKSVLVALVNFLVEEKQVAETINNLACQWSHLI